MQFVRFLPHILCGLFCNVGIVWGQLPCNPVADLTIMLDNSADVTAANFELIKSSFKEFTYQDYIQVSFSTVSIY